MSLSPPSSTVLGLTSGFRLTSNRSASSSCDGFAQSCSQPLNLLKKYPAALPWHHSGTRSEARRHTALAASPVAP
eukprot:462880-Hanusia_phi.AAC.1